MFLIKEVVKSELYFRKVPLVITGRTDGEGTTDVREAVAVTVRSQQGLDQGREIKRRALSRGSK